MHQRIHMCFHIVDWARFSMSGEPALRAFPRGARAATLAGDFPARDGCASSGESLRGRRL